MQDPIPDWISHIALVSDGKVLTGPKEDILEMQELHKAREDRATSMATTASAKRTTDEGKPVVVLRNVNVSYGERKVKIHHIHPKYTPQPPRHRYSNPSTGPSAKANGGTFKVQTVCTLFPSIFLLPHTRHHRIRQNHPPVPPYRRPPPILHPTRPLTPLPLHAPAPTYPNPTPPRAHRRRLARARERVSEARADERVGGRRDGV